MDLALQQKIQTRFQAVQEARQHLVPYIKLLHPDPADPADASLTRYDVAAHHALIAEHLEAVKSGDLLRLIITMPPRHGKTEEATKSFPPWFIGDQPEKSVLVGTYSDNFAIDLGRAVRANIEHPATAQVFPELKLKSDARAGSRMETTKGGFIAAVGRGSAITGRGGDLLVVDDPIKDRKEADSTTIREQLWKWFTQVFSTRLMTDKGAIIVIQTRWHEDDLVGRLTDPRNKNYDPRQAKKWKVLDLPALARTGDPLGRAPDTALWPKRFSKQFLLDIKQQDPRGFSALYQGQPSPDEGVLILEDYMHTYGPQDMPDPDTMRWYLASDHAVSLDQQADKTCFGAVGVDPYGDIWVHPQLTWKRLPTDQAIEGILWLARKLSPLAWFAEKGVIEKSIGPFVRKRMTETSTFVSLRTFPTATDKPTRAASIIGRMALGHVHFPAFAHWWPDAKHQMLTFPYGSEDDFVDFLSLVGLGLDTLTKGTPTREPEHLRRQPPAVGTVGWLKDQARRKQREQRSAYRQGW